MALEPEILRRAAILIATLDAESADRLLDQLAAEDAAEVRRAVLELAEVDAHEEQEVIARFLHPDAESAGGRAPVQENAGVELCLSAAAEHVETQAVMARACSSASDVRALCDRVPADELVDLLSVERPQTIALVLSRLSEPRALHILTALTDEVQLEVMRRWMELDVADPILVQEIEQELCARLSRHSDAAGRRGMGLAQLAGVVQMANPAAQRKLLATLTHCDAAAAETISTPRLAFDDLEYLSGTGLAGLLRQADPRTLVLALAGATESFAERVARQLSPVDGRELLRAINSLGPTRLADVEAAQRELTRIAEKLFHDHDAVVSPLPLSTAE
ncbi:MAG TPA: FliG C-terminal domain-containing protein [Pirellulales bacterium]|nr:FliG C-terminal domain-containing protein [Pirellulales bacterium]